MVVMIGLVFVCAAEYDYCLFVCKYALEIWGCYDILIFVCLEDIWLLLLESLFVRWSMSIDCFTGGTLHYL